MAEQQGGAGESVEALYDRFDAARGTAKWVRLGTVLLILIVILGTVLKIKNQVMVVVESYTNPQTMQEVVVDANQLLQPYISQAEGALRETLRELVPVLQQQATELVPVLQEEVMNELERQWPELVKQFQSEIDTLTKNVATEARDKLEREVKEMVEGQTAHLVNSLEITEADGEVLQKNLAVALEGAFVEVMFDRLGKAEDAILRIRDKSIRMLPRERQAHFQGHLEDAWDSYGDQMEKIKSQLGGI